MKSIKNILWHILPVGLGLAVCACTGPNVPKESITCAQDGTMAKRDGFGNISSIRTNQICIINQDGSFTVKERNDEN